MKKLVYLFSLVLLITLIDCTSAKSQSKKDKNKKNDRCEEDVARYRPRYLAAADTVTPVAATKPVGPVVPQKDITNELNQKLDSIAARNAQVKTGQGYRILVYSGKSSEEVKMARTKIYSSLPNADIYTDFKSPNQRVKVGNCIDRQEAYNLLGKLKKSFANAVIIPDQINIKAK